MNTTRTWITLLVSVTLAGASAMAQGPGSGGPGGPGGPGAGPGQGHGGPGGPGGFDNRPMMGQQQGGMSMGPQRDPMHENLFPPEMILRHENDIGLTDDQKKAVREAVLNAQTQFTKLQWEMQDAHQALAKLVKEDKIDEAKSVEQLDKVLKAETEMKRLQLSLAIQLKNQLTSAQIKQLQELKPDKFRGARMSGRQGQGPGTGPGQPPAPDQAPGPGRR